MTLADERLRELDNPSLTENERVLIRCRVAADLTHKGQYEAAREALGELCPGIGERPDVHRLPPDVAAGGELIVSPSASSRAFSRSLGLGNHPFVT